jgi:hypothetical protein
MDFTHAPPADQLGALSSYQGNGNGATKPCLGPNCRTLVPVDLEGGMCPMCVRALEELRRWAASRCEATGEDADGDWRCNDIAETRKHGRLCVGHYNQLKRTGSMKRLRKRQTTAMFEGWANVMREHGWTVIPPEKAL